MICWMASHAAARFRLGSVSDWVTSSSRSARPAPSIVSVPSWAWRSVATRMASGCAATVAPSTLKVSRYKCGACRGSRPTTRWPAGANAGAWMASWAR